MQQAGRELPYGSPSAQCTDWRTKAEELQRQLEALSEVGGGGTAFEHSGTAMMVIEDDMTISLANRMLAAMTGYDVEEVRRGHKWTEFVDPDDLPRMIDYHRRRRECPESVPSSYEFRLRDPSGRLRTVVVNVAMIPGTRKSIVSLTDISERKAMEEAVRHSEQRYRDLFENANDIIYVHDTQGRFVDANAAALATYGYTREELCSVTLNDIVDPAWREAAFEKASLALSEGMAVGPFELLTRTKEGREVWVEVRARRMAYEGGVAVQGIARDTTARRAAEEALRASEQRFRETAELLPAIVCEIGPDRRFTYVNQLGLCQFGYTAQDIAGGVSVDEVVSRCDYERLLSSFMAVVGGERHGPREYLMRHRDGTERYYVLDSAPMVRGGKVVGIRTCLLDIHERKTAAQRVAESESRFRGIFDGSPVGIALFDLEGRCIEANGAFAAVVGIRAGENMPTLAALAGLSEEELQRLGDGTALRVERTPDGRQAEIGRARCLEWHIKALGYGPGITVLAQVVDVTAQREAEARMLAEARKAADDARRMLAGVRKDLTQTFTFQNMVGRSAAMRAIFDMLPPIAETPATVLICGESGTGKELVARAIHEMSPRKTGPFVALNCAALPDTLLESELFGYKAGAFTDAKKDKPGKFARAEGGTLFLDEIGDITPAMQAKLLRVLQERVYEPLGATAPVRTDVRIVAATNRDLQAAVKEGRFREDLYYRIKVLQITLPPLRDRPSDIPLLCEHFRERFNARYGKMITGISQEALDVLLAYQYPGNIRELENIIEHAFVFCRSDTIALEHLPPEISRAVATAPATRALSSVRNFDELEKLFIEGILAETGGNKLQAARRLGMHKATLFRKLKRLGISPAQAGKARAS